MRADFEVADVLNKHWPEVMGAVNLKQINTWQLRTLSAIKKCRTSALGGHIDACTDCGVVRVSYNSCRNRHCPKCQGKQREKWIEKRQEELLPVPYFHVVFTLPDTLNGFAMSKPRMIYDTLFESAWYTIKKFGLDSKHLGAQAGMISILHTWGQTMGLHPHIHCIVPGAGITQSSEWKQAKSKGKYLFPVKALSKVYRAKYVEILKKKMPDISKKVIDQLFKKDWVVYAKRAFGNASSVIEYLGRYTHKVAISNHRITNIDKQGVTFTYKDYRKQGRKESITMEAIEFIRRFSLHILPKGYTRIRHYGILSSTSKKTTIQAVERQTTRPKVTTDDPRKLEVYNPLMCKHCKTETMVVIEIISPRGPPQEVGADILQQKKQL